jgi:hypothetical protein
LPVNSQHINSDLRSSSKTPFRRCIRTSVTHVLGCIGRFFFPSQQQRLYGQCQCPIVAQFRLTALSAQQQHHPGQTVLTVDVAEFSLSNAALLNAHGPRQRRLYKLNVILLVSDSARQSHDMRPSRQDNPCSRRRVVLPFHQEQNSKTFAQLFLQVSVPYSVHWSKVKMRGLLLRHRVQPVTDVPYADGQDSRLREIELWQGKPKVLLLPLGAPLLLLFSLQFIVLLCLAALPSTTRDSVPKLIVCTTCRPM